jgi:hypothetical protein
MSRRRKDDNFKYQRVQDVPEWRLAMTGLFPAGGVAVGIHGDGTINIYEAVDMASGLNAIVTGPRSDINTVEVHVIKALEKLHAMLAT